MSPAKPLFSYGTVHLAYTYLLHHASHFSRSSGRGVAPLFSIITFDGLVAHAAPFYRCTSLFCLIHFSEVFCGADVQEIFFFNYACSTCTGLNETRRKQDGELSFFWIVFAVFGQQNKLKLELFTEFV